MKYVVLTASLMFSLVSHASVLCEGIGNSYNRGYCLYMTCAPEVQQGNISATERVLKTLAEGNLKEASKFKTVVATISALPTDKKVSAYLTLAGIQSDEELVQFIGSRDSQIQPQYINSLMSTTDLSRPQAEMVLEKIAASLLGERK